MSDKKPCPFCGEMPANEFEMPGLVGCANTECQIWNIGMTVDSWNARASTNNSEISTYPENDSVSLENTGGSELAHEGVPSIEEAIGFAFSYACQLLDEGIDPRTVEIPEILEMWDKREENQ